MYLRKIKRPNGIYLAIQESYYDSVSKQSRTRTVKSLGYLEKLKEEYDDPVAHFTQVAAEMTKQKKEDSSATISINSGTKLDVGTGDVKNVGYGILKELYKELELDKFWNRKTQGMSIEYSPDQIFKLLVFSRVLKPASKKGTYDQKGFYFENFDNFSLDDIYHALDLICDNSQALQKWIFEHSEKICARDLSVSYFDCTNYYFDIGNSDMDTLDDEGKPIDKDGNQTAAKYRKRGPEKNHRPDPIVEMGLLTDRNGIPLAFDMFPGNESEKVHMRPIINRLKNEFSDGRVIFVADKGLNTSDNIYFLNGSNKGDFNERDGYVYGQSVRGADEEFKSWVLSGGYKKDRLTNDDGETVVFTHKSRISPKRLHVNVPTTRSGKKGKVKKPVDIDQKQMVYYSEKYARKQRADRDVMINRARDLIEHPQKYDRITAAGSSSYVQNIAFDKNTGEVVSGKALSLDIDKIQEEEKYDGYYSVVTSELSLSDTEIWEIYRGLARIEDTFKISKSEFDSRPVFVRTNNHIDAHFTTCFTALVLLRLLQAKLKTKFPVGKVIKALREYCCVQIDTNLYQFTYFDEILQECNSVFSMDLDNKYRTRQQVQRMLRY